MRTREPREPTLFTQLIVIKASSLTDGDFLF